VSPRLPRRKRCSRMSRIRVAGLSAAVATAVAVALLPAGAVLAATGTISGVAFNDSNRDGVQEPGEAPFSGHILYLYDAAGTTYLGNAQTDSSGHYAFSGHPDGSYRVTYSATTYNSLKQDWVPTTTPTSNPSITVDLVGAAAADFGWRPIVRSTDVNAPTSSYIGANGLHVASYDDVVPARTIYDAVMGSSLIGPEAAFTTIRFDYGSTSTTTTSVARGADGSYTNYQATCMVTYASWLSGGDRTLTHEYGHAWSLYNAYVVQGDPSLAGYLSARGLTGDPRLGTSYAWTPAEMIAEDYRQLFGSANAAAGTQMNADIAAAAAVPGLKTYLSTTFTTPPAGAPAPAPAPVSVPVVSSLAVTPTPVKASATFTFSLDQAATVTARILKPSGAVVRTLVTAAAEPAGPVSIGWNRTNDAGKRVATGTYTVTVSATDAAGTANASASFAVG
jgi:hypothetical protein